MVPIVVLAVVSLAAAPAPRPPGAAPGTIVARVVQGHGPVKLRDGAGKQFEVRAGTGLSRSDTLIVPRDAFVLVQVEKNQQVVRVDDDMELAVADIAVLDDPNRAKEDLARQLERLLTPAEKKGFEDRMVGWYAGMTAANVPAAPPEKAKKKGARGAKKEEEAKEGVAPRAAAPASSPPPPPSEDAPSPPPAPEPRPSPSPTGGGAPAASSQPLRPQRVLEASRGEAVQKGLLSRADSIERAPTLESCLASQAKVVELAGRHGGRLRVYVLSDGELRVRLEGGLEVPACAVEWFKAHPPTGAGKWELHLVTLP